MNYYYSFILLKVIIYSLTFYFSFTLTLGWAERWDQNDNEDESRGLFTKPSFKDEIKWFRLEMMQQLRD